jgi:hypothetical protein
MGPAAPCGLTCYESAGFGPEYRDNLFACYFNLHKVSRHVLTPSGATFATADEDFVTSPDLDSHPTDVLEDADGSLVVVDTGGWYKLCCPSSQLQKPDVLGGVYRVRRQETPRVEDPRGLKLSWKTMMALDLVNLLDDPRPAIQHRAIETLAGKGEGAIALLAQMVAPDRSVNASRNAVWTATRFDHQAARVVTAAALLDPDETIRQVAIQHPGAGRPGCVSQGLPLNPLFFSRAAGDCSCHAWFISRSAPMIRNGRLRSTEMFSAGTSRNGMDRSITG